MAFSVRARVWVWGQLRGKEGERKLVLMKCLLDCVADPLPNMIMS